MAESESESFLSLSLTASVWNWKILEYFGSAANDNDCISSYQLISPLHGYVVMTSVMTFHYFNMRLFAWYLQVSLPGILHAVSGTGSVVASQLSA